ncbi:hypothetical protein [Mycobacterium decipiens]|uniref:DUF4267 domain-containing protein n=1 Tax=Mycobacterium decipiens TaxID=1430326 RepID=A0A1X2LZD5_9MYCO|nr:hypothetical protein [Mycobacterium decipiens]OSC42669.1 hypothetical protein B8W66_03785 [Mycobacterium decipiens]
MSIESATAQSPISQPLVLRRAFGAAAIGRILLGTAAYIAPQSQTRMNAVPDRMLSTELRYLIRIFGARALALGVAYLISDEHNRRRWQRIGLMVDTLDNVNALIELSRLERGDPRVVTLLRLIAVTGPYAALGAVGVVQAQWVRRTR